MRLVWPAIIWNAGRPGILYTCLIRDTGPASTYLSGDLSRMDEGKEVKPGQCKARRVK